MMKKADNTLIGFLFGTNMEKLAEQIKQITKVSRSACATGKLKDATREFMATGAHRLFYELYFENMLKSKEIIDTDWYQLTVRYFNDKQRTSFFSDMESEEIVNKCRDVFKDFEDILAAAGYRIIVQGRFYSETQYLALLEV